MRIAKQTAVLVLAMGAILWIVGCGAKRNLDFLKDAVPATGHVTLAGKPLPGATVSFIPTIQSAGGRDATGVTDASGVYQMSTLVSGVSPDQSKGVVPGEYVVVISRVAMPDGTPPPADIIDENDAIAKGARQSVPAKYTNPETSPLKVRVAPPKAENDFKL